MTKVNGKHDPYVDPASIGNLAIMKGWATQEDVTRALAKQETRVPLGELLVEDKVLTRDQLEDLLFEQDLLRAPIKESTQTKRRLQRQRGKLQEATASVGGLAIAMHAFVVKGG